MSVEQGFCSNPWIPYNGHCFHLNRSSQTWSNALKECRKEGGDLVSAHNVEEQSFIISQLGFGMQKHEITHITVPFPLTFSIVCYKSWKCFCYVICKNCWSVSHVQQKTERLF